MSLLLNYSIVLLLCFLNYASAANIKTRLIEFEDCGESERDSERKSNVFKV